MAIAHFAIQFRLRNQGRDGIHDQDIQSAPTVQEPLGRNISISNDGLPDGLPEDEAKQILAERFARGDISSDEFLERSSILNWTPGAQPLPSKSRKKRSI